MIELTIKYGFDGSEFNTYDWRKLGYLHGRHKNLIKKLNFLFESVEVIGNGRKRVYRLGAAKNPITEEQAINLTMDQGYLGNEFNSTQWKEKGYLESRDSNTLVRKLKTIYNNVDRFGQSNNRLYVVENEKDEIVLNQNFIKDTSKKKKMPQKKMVKKEIPKLSIEEELRINRIKQEFLRNYFEYRVVKYRQDDKRKKYVDIFYEPRHVISKKAIKSLFKKYRFTYKYDEFLSIIMLLVTSAVNDFRPTSKVFNWDEVNTDGSASNLNLHKFVYNSYIDGIKQYRYIGTDEKLTSRWVEEDGKRVKKNVVVEFPRSSTDIKIELDDGDTNINQLLDNESHYGYQHSLYHPNKFLRWYNTNQNLLLTESQKEFMYDMRSNFHEEGSEYTLPYSQDDKQPYSCNSRRNRMHRIKHKINDIYINELPKAEKITLLHMKKQADLHLLNELIHIVYNADYEHVSDLNADVCNWLYKHLNNSGNDVLSNLLHDNLTVGELKHLNRSLHNDYLICNRLIYKIVSLVEQEIEQLHNFDTSVKTERLVSNQRWPKEKRKAYDDNLREFKNQPVKVYDFNTGKLLRQEKYVSERKNYIIQTLDTYGNRREEHEEEENNFI